MRPFASTISLDEARRRLSAAIGPIARTERLPLDQAVGRVAAENAISSIDVPQFDRSAVDGYAVVAADTAAAAPDAPISLRIIDRVYTGQMSAARVASGGCVEIATGAPLPVGADAVIMVEQTEPAGDSVRVLAAVPAGQHVGRRGADIAAGGAVVSSGELLNPGRIGALAAIGRPDALVYARPRVAILSTGNEVAEPGQPLLPGQIFDVNRFTLAAIVATHGGVAESRPPVGDTLDRLIAAVDECSGADLIVFPVAARWASAI